MIGKIRTLNQDVIDTYDNVDLLCFKLTAREAIILSGQTQYIGWRTRWTNLTHSNSELNAIKERIESALLEFEECEMSLTLEEICTIIESCGIVTAMQSDIAANTSDIAQNVANIVINSEAIEQLEFDATAQAALLVNHGDRLDDLEFDATAQAALLVNHGNRLDDLESENPVGVETETETITVRRKIDTIVWTTNQSSVDVDMTQYSYQDIELELKMNSTAASPQGLSMYANNDTTATNYTNRTVGSAAVNGALIGFVSPINTAVVTQPLVVVKFTNLISNVRKSAHITESQSLAVTGSNLSIRPAVWIWEVAYEDIETLTFNPSTTQLAAYGYIDVYAMVDIEVVTSVEATSPPTPTWQAKLDFSTDIDDYPVTTNGIQNIGGGYIATAMIASKDQLTLILYTAAFHQFTEIDVEYFFSTDGSGREIRYSDGSESLVLSDNPIVNLQSTETFACNKLTDDYRLTLDLSTFPDYGNGRLYSVTYRGTGEVPPELAPYEI